MGFTNWLSGGNEKRSINAAKQGVKVFDQLQTPDVKKMVLELQELVQQGRLSPEQATAYLQESSGTANIQTDPSLRADQMDTLSGLRDIVDNKGMTASMKSRLARIQSEEATRARGARESILEDAQARGMGGAGTTLGANLINTQQQANRESQRDLDVAAMAEEQALQALMAKGNLAGDIQSTDFDQQARQAEAQDAINRFNASTRTDVGVHNTDARNTAAASNLGEAQRVADTNVGISNDEQEKNKALDQLDYENRYKKAAGKSQAYGGVANAYGQAASNTTQLVGSGIQAGGSAFGGWLGKK